jgi:hypothetical protein
MNSNFQSLPNLPSLTYDQLKASSSTHSTSTTSTSIFLQSSSDSTQTIPDYKRPRDSLPVTSNKKGKTSFGPITKLATELFDSNSNEILGFRCFRECEILGNQLENQELIQSEIDDDVSSEAEHIISGVDFLLEELESVLISCE